MATKKVPTIPEYPEGAKARKKWNADRERERQAAWKAAHPDTRKKVRGGGNA